MSRCIWMLQKRKSDVPTSHIQKTERSVKNPVRTLNLWHNMLLGQRTEVRHVVNSTTLSDFLQKQGKLQIGKMHEKIQDNEVQQANSC